MHNDKSSADISQSSNDLFKQSCDFVLGVADLGQLPEADRAEYAFVGRSNVGKSSLLNALVGRRNLARTSNTPGRTQQLNFFDLAGTLYLVDLPGYGYAKVSKSQVKEWTKLLKKYLAGRVNLRRAFVLVDSRHGIKASDTEMFEMLDVAGVPYVVVLTKIDKLKDQALKACIEKTEKSLKKHPAAFPTVISTSAEKKLGLESLQELITAD